MKSYFTIAFIFFFVSNLMSNSGSIGGRVTDAQSGEPLIGVAVQIEGTTRGVFTDVKGDYILPGLAPGSYNLIFNYIGYSRQTIQGVEVFQDRTTTINSTLTSQAVQADEIIIMAERPVVERDRTTTVSYINSQSLAELPTTNIADVIKLQAGVVSGADGSLHFRGGRSREVGYLVDGIPVTNNFSQSGGSTVSVENSFVNEVQVITGTFDAQYGSAQSGIISIVTKDPGSSYNGSFAYYSGGYQSNNENRYPGLNSYNPIGETDFQATLTGPILKGDKLGFFISGRINNSDGYLNGIRRFNIEDGVVIDAYRRWFRENNSVVDARAIEIPDSLATGDNKIVSMNPSKSYSGTFKISFRPINTGRINYSLIVDDRESEGFSNAWRFAPDGRRTYYSTGIQHLMVYRQSFSNSLFLNSRVSIQTRDSESYAFDDINDPRYVPVGGVEEVSGFVVGNVDSGRSESTTNSMVINTDLTWQVNRFVEFKAGIEYRKYRYSGSERGLRWIGETRRYPDAEDSAVSFNDYLQETIRLLPLQRPVELGDQAFLDYKHEPVEFSAFVQDKIEFGNNMVLRMGLRYDRYDPNEPIILDKRAIIDRIGQPENRGQSTTKSQLSPRLGLSFPISSTGAFRVAYGHFFQMASYSLLYTNPINERTNLGRLDGATVGNPDLKPERTIKYEVGLQQQIGSQLGLDITMYYSNIRNLLGLELVSTLDNITYRRYINRDYGAVKGVTISLEKLRSGLVSGGIDYTYQYARGSSSNPNDLQTIQVSERIGGGAVTFVERQILPLDWDQRHTVNASLVLSKPGNWLISTIGTIGSGLPYTPSSLTQMDFPENEFKNSALKPVRYNVDLQAQKSFRPSEGLFVDVYMRVFNLLNTENHNNVDSGTGRADRIGRRPFDQAEFEQLVQTINLFSTNEADQRASWFSAPRQIQFGVTINF
jgi:outer membrane receptor protein involved in Fe transport